MICYAILIGRKEEAFSSLRENTSVPGLGSRGDFALRDPQRVVSDVMGPTCGQCIPRGCFYSTLQNIRCPAASAAHKGILQEPRMTQAQMGLWSYLGEDS